MLNIPIHLDSRRKSKIKKRVTKATMGGIKAVFLIGFCFVILYPVLMMISKAFMERKDIFDNTVILVLKNFTLQNFEIAIMLTDYWNTLVNTLSLSVLVTVLETISCLIVAYGLARFEFKLRGLFMGLVVFTIIVPPQLILTPMYVQFRNFNPFGLTELIFGGSLNLIDTYIPFALLASTGMGVKNGLFILIFFQFFKNMPKELEEAAHIDGANSFTTFTRIMVPNAVTSIVTVSLFGFMWQYNDMNYSTSFLQNKMVFSRVYYNLERFTLEVYDMLGVSQYDMTMTLYVPLVKSAGVLLFLAPLLLLFLFCQRFFVESIERVGIVG
jgi:multiple sugar transport system permease protein